MINPISRIIATIGGLLTLIGGIVDVALRHSLEYYMYGLNIVNGAVMIYLGVLGIIAGLMTLYGIYKNDRDFVIAGGAIGLAATEFSILSILGGLSIRRVKEAAKA